MNLFIKLISCLILFYAYLASVNGHTYHLGSCATVDPMPEFDMRRFLGKWYGIQKTSTGSKCLIYNFTKTEEPNVYKIEQVSEHPVLGLVHDNNYHYTGTLKADIESVPAKMTVKFPLSVAGTASYVVFMTDYTSYAGIYSCQKLAFANRHSATLLSREKTLDKIYLDKLRSKLSSFNVNPYDLSIISQSKCESSHPYNINITKETFSAHNIGNVVRKAGVKVGDGVEYVVNGVSHYYNKIKKDEHGAEVADPTNIKISSGDYRPSFYTNKDVEILPDNYRPMYNSNDKDNRDTEWL